LGHKLTKKVQPLRRQRRSDSCDARGIAPRPVKACYQSIFHRIAVRAEHNRNGAAGRHSGTRCLYAAGRNDQIHSAANEVRRQRRKAIKLTIPPSVFERDVQALLKAAFRESLANEGQTFAIGSCRGAAEDADYRNRRLLRACGERPRRRTAEQRDELAPSHSITSSTRQGRMMQPRTHYGFGGITVAPPQSFGRISTNNMRSGRSVLFSAVCARFPVSKK
jgi:hypothetical protein